jgi:hypothetical protein
MNYSKLRLLHARTQLSDVKFARSIGMTDHGYRKMLDNQTCTVERLETICKVYNIPVAQFFDETSNIVSEPTMPYGDCRECLRKDGIIETLKDQLQEKEKKIEQLNREIGGTAPSKTAQVG